MTRTGVIWSVADTASAWWVQPEDDPMHPVYVRRAGKHERFEHREGTLFEVPRVAEAARANVLRAEIIRKRGIFPVIDSQSVLGSYHGRGTNHIFLVWHSDPQCQRAVGKERYDPDNRPQGIVYSYRPEGRGIRRLEQSRWTALDVADALVSGEQAPSCLCPDCVVNLDAVGPAIPARPGPPGPVAAAGPAKSTPVPGSRVPGVAAARTRPAVTLTRTAADDLELEL